MIVVGVACVGGFLAVLFHASIGSFLLWTVSHMCPPGCRHSGRGFHFARARTCRSLSRSACRIRARFGSIRAHIAISASTSRKTSRDTARMAVLLDVFATGTPGASGTQPGEPEQQKYFQNRWHWAFLPLAGRREQGVPLGLQSIGK